MDDNQQDIETLYVDDETAGERLDKFVAARLTELSRSQIQQLIKAGEVLVNDHQEKPAYKIEPDDCITVQLPEIEDITPQPEAIPLNILYEDDYLAVINKPAGMVVHPAYGHTSGTLVNALLHRYPHLAETVEDINRAGIVHRLDKDTSGVLIVALNEAARFHLMDQFRERATEKHYIALVEGHPPNHIGRIDAPVGRDSKNRKRMAVVRDGRDSLTEFHVRHLYQEHALLDVQIFTGRTHQIRVHMAFINCPVVGDRIYGFRRQRIKMKRLFLHAARISFTHPVTEERLTFETPLPGELQHILNNLPE